MFLSLSFMKKYILTLNALLLSAGVAMAQKINFEELHKKYCLVEYENKKYIKNVEYIEDTIILKALNEKEDIMIFPKGTYYNLRILGILKGCLHIY